MMWRPLMKASVKASITNCQDAATSIQPCTSTSGARPGAGVPQLRTWYLRLRIGTNSLCEGLLTWYIYPIIRRHIMSVSQHSDKPRPAPKDNYDQLHSSFRWRGPETFN